MIDVNEKNIKGLKREKKRATQENKWVVHKPMGINRGELSKTMYELVHGYKKGELGKYLKKKENEKKQKTN